jgi:hypothetical protein
MTQDHEGAVPRAGRRVDLSRSIPSHLEDARVVRHSVAEQLRDVIQTLIDAKVTREG